MEHPGSELLENRTLLHPNHKNHTNQMAVVGSQRGESENRGY